MKELTVNNHLIYFSDNAYDGYNESVGDIRKNLDKHLTLVSIITNRMKMIYPYFTGFYISSTYRKEDIKSPHSEGRGIDISRIKCGDTIWYQLIESKDEPEWSSFQEILKEYFCIHKYNQIIAPDFVLDVRNLDVSLQLRLMKQHQDHYHLNIPKTK